MNYSDYCITYGELMLYKDAGKVPSKLELIWADMLKKIDKDEVKQEAEKKGFELVDNPDLDDDVIAAYQMLIVPDATENLKHYFQDNVYSYIVCLKD